MHNLVNSLPLTRNVFHTQTHTQKHTHTHSNTHTHTHTHRHTAYCILPRLNCAINLNLSVFAFGSHNLSSNVNIATNLKGNFEFWSLVTSSSNVYYRALHCTCRVCTDVWVLKFGIYSVAIQRVNGIVTDIYVSGGSECQKQSVHMQQCVVASILFSIAVCTVVDGTLCMFSDAACCSRLTSNSQPVVMV